MRRSIIFVRNAVLIALPLAASPTVETTRKPAPQINTFNVAVPMRDGVVLRANVFRPGAPARYPAILMRTPYGKGDAITPIISPSWITVTLSWCRTCAAAMRPAARSNRSTRKSPTATTRSTGSRASRGPTAGSA